MTRPSSDCHWRRAAQRNGGRRVAIMWKITTVKPIFESSRQSRGWNRISTRYLRAGKHFVTGRRQCSQRGLPRPNPRRRFARRANRRSPVRGKQSAGRSRAILCLNRLAGKPNLVDLGRYRLALEGGLRLPLVSRFFLEHPLLRSIRQPATQHGQAQPLCNHRRVWSQLLMIYPK